MALARRRTQALLGVLDELLESWHVQEAEALGDGVEQQEAVRPADGGLQGRRGVLLEEINGSDTPCRRDTRPSEASRHISFWQMGLVAFYTHLTGDIQNLQIDSLVVQRPAAPVGHL